MKENKGITLMMLIITIIILLILAGVSIVMLSGENGILAQGSSASYKKESAISNAQEEVISIINEAMYNYIDSEDVKLVEVISIELEDLEENWNIDNIKYEYVKYEENDEIAGKVILTYLEDGAETYGELSLEGKFTWLSD